MSPPAARRAAAIADAGSFGTARPASWSASSGGVVVKVLVLRSHVSSPPVNFCDSVSPRYASSSVGTPRTPADPPSLSHAALIAPRTTRAPVAGVQKITGLSDALKVEFRLSGARPAPSSMVGKPRSPSGPPSDSYFSRIAPCT